MDERDIFRGKVLYKFLKSKCALLLYLERCINRHPDCASLLKDNIITFLSSWPCSHISAAFCWNETKEGWKYWNDLEEEFFKFNDMISRDLKIKKF